MEPLFEPQAPAMTATAATPPDSSTRFMNDRRLSVFSAAGGR
ncbi:hypothetical protein [Nonomuraea sp. SYSU D8015]|nr:hypothetical protein [Nonomuraea sp. SYSU D8015]